MVIEGFDIEAPFCFRSCYFLPSYQCFFKFPFLIDSPEKLHAGFLKTFVSYFVEGQNHEVVTRDSPQNMSKEKDFTVP